MNICTIVNGSKIVTLKIGYNRNKKPEFKTFRTATERDVRTFQVGSRQWFVSNDGSARQVTINSRLKEWKKRSAIRDYTMQISVKYGMYEFDQWRNCGCGDDDFSRFLIELEPCENCSDGCIAIQLCEGCSDDVDQMLCARCYKEHNSIHFNETGDAHRCKCDNCENSREFDPSETIQPD